MDCARLRTRTGIHGEESSMRSAIARRTRRGSARCRSSILSAVLGIVGVGLVPASAQATQFKGKDWTIDLSGYVNAFYTDVHCSGDSVGGVALAGKAIGCGGQSSRTTIGNGLLPNALITKATTNQDGIDISAQVGLMVHTATSDALSPNNGIDVRQAFFTLGTRDLGTFKLGRDYGIFGANAILSDMTLLGVGAPTQATQRGRVALGHIGAGYAYLGTYGQMAYTSPTSHGFTFSGGVFSPVNNTGAYDSRSAPQVQAQLSYSVGHFKGWIGGKTQRFYATAGSGATPANFTMTAGEIGASWKFGMLSLLGNIQSGRGIGILTDGDQGNVKGINYLLQGMLQVTDKLKLGLSGGVSRNRSDLASTGDFKSNSNVTGGLYYALTKSVTLDAELSQTRSKDYLGDIARMNGVSLGGILFF